MHVTDFLGIPKGHHNLQFVDVTNNLDTKVFIDPCLIERGEDNLSMRAATKIAAYEDKMFVDMRNGCWDETTIFDVAHEINETKLGYGNGENGKGKTAYGMQKSLSNLYALFNVIPSIERIQDVVVFVERFSKDCMSDLLTNILRKELCEFTSEQMEAHQKSPDGIQIQKAWDANAGEWRNEELPYWLIENKKILLVPKMWVRKHYLFSTDQYLSRVIVERIRRENGQEDVPKKEIKRRFDKSDPHWKYKTAIQYTKKNPDALVTYHERMNGYYDRKNGAISDDDLDMATYGYCIKNKRM